MSNNKLKKCEHDGSVRWNKNSEAVQCYKCDKVFMKLSSGEIQRIKGTNTDWFLTEIGAY